MSDLVGNQNVGFLMTRLILSYLNFLGLSDCVDLTLIVLTLDTSDISLVSDASLCTSSDPSGLNSEGKKLPFPD